MYAYSRIEKVSTITRSRSLDLTNLPPTSLANYYIINKPNHSMTTTRLDPGGGLGEDHDEVGEVFGVILSRKYPGCQDSYSTLSDEKQTSSFHNVVKRSFSMRRSASIAEGFRRCHCNELRSSADEDHLYHSAKHNSQNNHVKKRGRLFKVWRSLFGL